TANPARHQSEGRPALSTVKATPPTTHNDPNTMANQLGPRCRVGGDDGKSYPQRAQATARWSNGFEHRGQNDTTRLLPPNGGFFHREGTRHRQVRRRHVTHKEIESHACRANLRNAAGVGPPSSRITSKGVSGAGRCKRLPMN